MSSKIISRGLGLLTFTNTVGKQGRGIGNVVIYDNTPLIATAAHCVYDWQERQFNTDLAFRPRTAGRAAPLAVSRIAIPATWATEAIVDHDTAFLELEANSEGQLRELDPMPAIFNLPRGLEYDALGFGRYLGSRRQVKLTDRASSDPAMQTTLQAIRGNPRRGLSGGPWLTRHNGALCQNSVTSLSFRSAPGRVFGPYWGDVIEQTCRTLVDDHADAGSTLLWAEKMAPASRPHSATERR